MRQSDASIVHTIAQLKGRRLRMARALTGFSRQELFEKIGIATSTIDTWESGRVELSQKSAERVCLALKKVGVSCSSEWLLTGEGTPPRIMDDLEKTMSGVGSLADQHNGHMNQSVSSSFVQLKEFQFSKRRSLLIDDSMKKELDFFISIHPEALFHIVNKDFLNARYKVGDCVAGVIDRNISCLIGRVVIALLPDKKTVLCKIMSLNEDDSYNVFMGSDRLNERVQIINAAEVIWHRMSGRFS